MSTIKSDLEVEILHSKGLSERLKIDDDLKKLLFPLSIQTFYLERGIKQVEIKDEESFFSTSDNASDSNEVLANQIQSYDNTSMLRINQRKMTQVLLQRKRLQKSKWLQKKIKLVPLCIKREPNPYTSIRFLEYNLLLDSDIFLDETQKTSKEFCIPNNIYDYKRAKTVTYDRNQEIFIISLHEKIPNDYNNINLKHYNYYVEWLRSLGNSRATDFIEVIQGIKESDKRSKKIADEYRQIDSKSRDSKIFIKKLDAIPKSYIFSKPYSSRTMKIDVETNESSQCEEEYSLSFLCMMGFDENNIDYILEKFLRLDIQSGFYTTGFHTYDPENVKFSRVYENLRVRNRFFDKIEFRVIFRGEEMWYEDSYLFKKSYASFVDVIYCLND